MRVHRLITMAQFARDVGITPGAVSNLCKGTLSGAMVGKRIDLDHPDAVKYLENRTPLTTVDPLYDRAVEECSKAGRYSSRFVREVLKIGSPRALKIVNMMRANGIAEGSSKAKKLADASATTRPIPLAPKVKEAPAIPGKGPTTVPAKTIAVPEDIADFLDWSLRDLISNFGTSTQFLDWLKATQMIEAINDKRLKNSATTGDLVARAQVKKLVLEPIDAAHVKLLTDGAKTMARRAVAMIDAGKNVLDVEQFIRKQITSFIRPIKNKVKRMGNA